MFGISNELAAKWMKKMLILHLNYSYALIYEYSMGSKIVGGFISITLHFHEHMYIYRRLFLQFIHSGHLGEVSDFSWNANDDWVFSIE